MRNRSAGQIVEGLWLLGTEESCVYLLEGRHASALISAGISYILPEIIRQISLFRISSHKIKHIIILHSHFDHVGIVPYFKRKWPQIRIHASARSWDVLKKTKAAEVIRDYTLTVCKRVCGNTDLLRDIDWQWRDDITGETVGQGNCIDLGEKSIEIHETPGHSSCSISAYIPQLKALFPSDAVAIPYRDEYVIAAGSSFEQYQGSLEKLAKLDVSMIGADHYGYITVSEAKHFIENSKKATDIMIRNLKETIDRTGSVDETAQMLVKRHFELRPDYFVSPEILISTYTQMLRQFMTANE